LPRRFEDELNILNQALEEMCSLVAHSIHRSVLSLVEKNEDYAHQVLRDEGRIDQMEIQIDDMAAGVIAREQPVARDMRFVIAAIKIDTDLERMGDLAVNIVERSLSLMREPNLPLHIDFTELSGLVQSMVLKCLEAFVTRDASIARDILASDDKIDQLRNDLQRDLIELMKRDTECVQRALDHLFIARSLERIADHTTNIAEDVIFLVQGVNVRHQAETINRLPEIA
jgi:phosphate transport system protein